MATPGDVTQLLRAYAGGSRAAFDQLLPIVYDELHRIAHRQLGGHQRDALLDTTALVHESYLKLLGQQGVDFADRGHFLGIAARAMRQVVIDHARRRAAEKRGGGVHHTTLEEGHIALDDQAEWLLSLDAALGRLAEHSERLARIVECRYFAGLTEEETAAALGISLRTAQRDWMKARAWLQEELRKSGS